MAHGSMTAADSVATTVALHPECVEVFERHHIEYCCRGDLSLQDAAHARHLCPKQLLGELEEAVAHREGTCLARNAQRLSTPDLVAHIVTTHHAYARRTLPVLVELAAKVRRVHGIRMAALSELAATVKVLAGEFIRHIDCEEAELFPVLQTRPHAPGVEALWLANEDEQLEIAELLHRVRSLTADFVPPAWACTSFVTLYRELALLERDTAVHVHLERFVLRSR